MLNNSNYNSTFALCYLNRRINSSAKGMAARRSFHASVFQSPISGQRHHHEHIMLARSHTHCTASSYRPIIVRTNPFFRANCRVCSCHFLTSGLSLYHACNVASASSTDMPLRPKESRCQLYDNSISCCITRTSLQLNRELSFRRLWKS